MLAVHSIEEEKGYACSAFYRVYACVVMLGVQ
jgi:hypothetical protein